MAKFDFNNSRYARFFGSSDNIKFLQTFLDTKGIIYTNYGWYLTQGKKASTATPTPPKGLATFSVKAKSLKAAPLMDLRAPLGESVPMDTEGVKWYSASIPDFIAKGTVETAMERDYRIKQFEIFGNDADIVEAWTDDVQAKIDSADATLNYMTANLISTGGIDYTGIGEGIQGPLHKANIPEENFVKAGAKAWTADDAKILTYMAEIEKKFRDDWGYTGALVWQMPRNMFYNVFLQNAEVKEFVKNYRTLNYVATAEGIPTTESMFRQAAVDLQGVSPIEVVTERERNVTATTDLFVHGWKENVAVLRPAGDAVEFEYTDNLDQRMFQKYGSSVVSKVFAKTNNGLGTLVNTTLNNGIYKEWHTDLMMSAVPALLNFPNLVIVDTTTAD